MQGLCERLRLWVGIFIGLHKVKQPSVMLFYLLEFRARQKSCAKPQEALTCLKQVSASFLSAISNVFP